MKHLIPINTDIKTIPKELIRGVSDDEEEEGEIQKEHENNNIEID